MAAPVSKHMDLVAPANRYDWHLTDHRVHEHPVSELGLR